MNKEENFKLFEKIINTEILQNSVHSQSSTTSDPKGEITKLIALINILGKQQDKQKSLTVKSRISQIQKIATKLNTLLKETDSMSLTEKQKLVEWTSHKLKQIGMAGSIVKKKMKKEDCNDEEESLKDSMVLDLVKKIDENGSSENFNKEKIGDEIRKVLGRNQIEREIMRKIRDQKVEEQDGNFQDVKMLNFEHVKLEDAGERKIRRISSFETREAKGMNEFVKDHSRKLVEADGKITQLFELLSECRLEVKELKERINNLDEKVDIKTPMTEEKIISLVNKSVDKRILNLMDNGILYSSKQRVVKEKEQEVFKGLKNIIEKSKPAMMDMTLQTTEELLKSTLKNIESTSPQKIEYEIYQSIYNTNLPDFTTLLDVEDSDFDTESESSSFSDSPSPLPPKPMLYSKNVSLSQLFSQVPEPTRRPLPTLLPPLLTPIAAIYQSTQQNFFDEAYKEIENFSKNLKNSNYHNVLYSLDNLKIQVSIKSPNFAKNNFCDNEGCVIATANKEDFLAVQNWRGLAIVKGGKIVSDFCDETVKGRGWKDVVYLEKSDVWDPWPTKSKRTRLGSGANIQVGQNGKPLRKERNSNKSTGGRGMRRERLSARSNGGRGMRRERLSNKSSGGSKRRSMRRERLSNRSQGGNQLAPLAVPANREGLSTGSIGDIGHYSKGYYYLYDHVIKGVFRRDLSPHGQPEQLINFSGSSYPGRSLKAGLNDYGGDDHLLMNKENLYLVYLDIKTLSMFDIIPKGEDFSGLKIFDFQTLSGNRVVTMSKNGLIMLMEYFPENKSSVLLSDYKIDLLTDEEAYSIAACPKSKVVVVNISRAKDKLSRLVVFEVGEDFLDQKDQLVLYNGKIEAIRTMEFYDYFQERLVLTALTGEDPLTMFGFMYDGIKIIEFVQRKVLSDLNMTYKLTRIEGGAEGLITADMNWNLIKIKYVC